MAKPGFAAESYWRTICSAPGRGTVATLRFSGLARRQGRSGNGPDAVTAPGDLFDAFFVVIAGRGGPLWHFAKWCRPGIHGFPTLSAGKSGKDGARRSTAKRKYIGGGD